MLRRFSITILLLMACVLAACGGSAPQLIGSYPSTDNPNTYQPPPEIRGGYQISYDTSIILEVDNVPFFNIMSGLFLHTFDAQVVSENSWQENGNRITEFVIIVPSHRFNELRNWLRERGTIVSETTFAHVQENNYITAESYYSTLTLTVRPYWWVKIHLSSWSLG
jgi:hypothetical protein